METIMSTNFGQLIESIEKMTVLELSELVKSLEEKFRNFVASLPQKLRTIFWKV